MIELQHLCKRFSGNGAEVAALRDVSLTIQRGEMFGVIGASGAGKSTLVRCINLLERPDSGKVLLDGEDLTSMSARDLRAHRREMGMIFQQFNLMPSRRVRENIAYPLLRAGLDRKNREGRVKELLELVELREKADAWPSQLSGGQKQRVAIARALASSPRVLLCDECTSALDPQTTASILALLKRINAELGVTVVLITHEMSVVREVCTRAAVLEKGAVAECADTLTLFSRPRSDAARKLTDGFTADRLRTLCRSGEQDVPDGPGRRHALLRYPPQSADEALISRVSRDFEVDCSILFGNIELLQGCAVGALGILCAGKEENIDGAFRFLRSCGVSVEEAEV